MSKTKDELFKTVDMWFSDEGISQSEAMMIKDLSDKIDRLEREKRKLMDEIMIYRSEKYSFKRDLTDSLRADLHQRIDMLLDMF